MNPVRKAVIPVAGLGSRFLPATKCVPKEMLPVYDRPVIELIVRELVEAGVEEIIFVIPPEGSITPKHFAPDTKLEAALRKKGKDKIADELAALTSLCKISTVVQAEPLGDGHAILQAEALVGDHDFFAFFGDEILDNPLSAPQQLLQARGDRDGCVLGVQQVPEADIHKFGIVAPATGSDTTAADAFEIVDFVEKPQPQDAPSDLALLGKNLCTSRIFEVLHRTDPGQGGEIRLVDAFILLSESESLFGKTLAGDRFDVGNPDGLLRASQYFAAKK